MSLPLTDITFCCLGMPETIEEDELEQFLHDLGGKIHQKVNKGTEYLVIGKRMRSSPIEVEMRQPYKQALTQTTKIVNEFQLLEIV